MRLAMGATQPQMHAVAHTWCLMGRILHRRPNMLQTRPDSDQRGSSVTSAAMGPGQTYDGLPRDDVLRLRLLRELRQCSDIWKLRRLGKSGFWRYTQGCGCEHDCKPFNSTSFLAGPSKSQAACLRLLLRDTLRWSMNWPLQFLIYVEELFTGSSQPRESQVLSADTCAKITNILKLKAAGKPSKAWSGLLLLGSC